MALSEKEKESRAFALVVYHALRKELASLGEDELDDHQAREMILNAVNLLPGYEARPLSQKEAEQSGRMFAPHLILIEKSDDKGDPVQLNIQDAVDSLRIIWRDFRRLTTIT